MDKKRIIFLVALIAVVLGGLGCGGADTAQLGDGADTAQQGDEADKTQQEVVYFNLVILLDLSDRIKYPGQVERDLFIIRHICSIFDSEVRNKYYLLSQERIQIKIAPQPVTYNSFSFPESKYSQIDVKKIPLPERTDSLPVFEQRFLAYSESLYSKASVETNFVGADIWGFFGDKIDDCIIVGPDKRNFRNILIILTDGYLQFDNDVLHSRLRKGNRTSYMTIKKFSKNPDWLQEFDTGNHGLIPINKDFGNLEVLVLEVRPHSILDTREWEIIQKYWCKWFDEMHITSRSVRKIQDSPAEVKNIIDQFIYNSK